MVSSHLDSCGFVGQRVAEANLRRQSSKSGFPNSFRAMTEPKVPRHGKLSSIKIAELNLKRALSSISPRSCPSLAISVGPLIANSPSAHRLCQSSRSKNRRERLAEAIAALQHGWDRSKFLKHMLLPAQIGRAHV